MTNIDLEIKDRTPLLLEMEAYAAENMVPIMELDGMETLLKFMELHQPKKVLEIGTAIGYSALRMIDRLPEVEITTIERIPERFEDAKKYIAMAGKTSQVTLIEGDALEVEDQVAANAPYDALFIDAAKGQYKNFFEMYEKYVTPGGVIFSDNVLYKGLVEKEKEELVDQSRRAKQLIRKIQNFNFWLSENENYETVILRVGDGLAVSVKRK